MPCEVPTSSRTTCPSVNRHGRRRSRHMRMEFLTTVGNFPLGCLTVAKISANPPQITAAEPLLCQPSGHDHVFAAEPFCRCQRPRPDGVACNTYDRSWRTVPTCQKHRTRLSASLEAKGWLRYLMGVLLLSEFSRTYSSFALPASPSMTIMAADRPGMTFSG